MSAEPGYMLIKVDLQGARAAAGEMAAVEGSIASTAATAKAAGATSAGTTAQTSKAAKGWSSLAKAAKLGALGMAGGAAALGLAVKSSITDVTELGLVTAGLRRNLDMTAREGSRWAAVAKARDIAPQSLNMAFKTLSGVIDGARKKGSEQEKMLQRLGLTQKEIASSQDDFSGGVIDVADAFGKMEGGAKRTALAAKLLGRGYQTVLPLFSDGSKGLEEYLGWADKYNVAMGDTMVDSTVRLKNAQRESKVAWMGVQRVLAEDFIGTVIDANREWQDFAEEFTDPKLTRDERITLVADKIKTGLSDAFNWVLNTGLPKLAEGMGQATPKIAAAFVHGFINANAFGKLFMGWWLASRLMGKSMMGLVGAAATKIATAFATRFAAWWGGTQAAMYLADVFGPNGKIGTRARPMMTKAGAMLGKTLGLAIAAAVVIWALPRIQDFASNVASDIFGGTQEENSNLLESITGFDLGEELGINSYSGPGVNTGQGSFVPHLGPGIGGGKGGKNKAPRLGKTSSADRLGLGGRPRGMRLAIPAAGGSEAVWTSDVNIDGNKVGEAVHRAAKKKGARR